MRQIGQVEYEGYNIYILEDKSNPTYSFGAIVVNPNSDEWDTGSHNSLIEAVQRAIIYVDNESYRNSFSL